VTPLVLSLPVGAHVMEVSAGGITRSLPLTVEAGTAIKQDIEFPTVVASGQLEITSEPAGAAVTIDGAARGATPLTIGAMAPGQHKVVITKGATVIRRTVDIQPGATTSIAGSMAEIDTAGWITLKASIGLDVLEDGEIIGTTTANRLMLPAGGHRLELKNAAFEVATTLAVQIVAGKTAIVTVPLPNGSLSVNALPWANVSIDGQDVGSTPLANLSLPVGTHEVVWRNPQLGERRRSIDVPARSPVHIGMYFAR
jgi:serine/threonine-protein kinase